MEPKISTGMTEMRVYRCVPFLHRALYGPHLVTGNTLVELRLSGHYCKHPVYSYDGCYVFCISAISSGTVIFPVVGTRITFDPLTMGELKYPEIIKAIFPLWTSP